MSSEITLYNELLSKDDWVALTEKGAKVHRDYHKTQTLVASGAVGAVLLPLALPGGFLATVGVVSAGTGIAVSGLTQAVVGATSAAGIMSFITSLLEKHPEVVAIGQIKEIKRRWWGQSGYDYQVAWLDGGQLKGCSWYLGEYLIKIHLENHPTTL
jgi:hypothetical protein